MIGSPVTEEELDQLEQQARAVRDAVRAGDLDTAYIIAKTSFEPGMLAMLVAAVCDDEPLDFDYDDEMVLDGSA